MSPGRGPADGRPPSKNAKVGFALEALKQRVNELTELQATVSARTEAEVSRHVFLVHGHNEQLKQTVARVLERLGLEPIILHEQADMNRTH